MTLSCGTITSVVAMTQVAQLMSHDVVHDFGRRHQALPVKLQAAIFRATGPAMAQFLDLKLARPDSGGFRGGDSVPWNAVGLI